MKGYTPDYSEQYMYSNPLIVRSKFEIYEYLDKHIAGQEDVKEQLAALGWAYNNRCSAILSGISPKSLPRFNAFITGTTGSGKTHCVRTLADALGIQVIVIDCSNLSQAGYEGTDINKALNRHMISGPIIILLDELDKLCTPSVSSSGNDTHQVIQTNLLTLVDANYGFSSSTQNNHVNNALVIATGAFSKYQPGIVNLGGENYRKLKQAGLTDEFIESFENLPFKLGAEKLKQAGFDDTFIEKLSHCFLNGWKEQIKRFGIIPELIGRFNTIIQTEPMSKSHLKTLICSDTGAYKKYRNMLPQFSLSRQKLDEIVDKAYNSQFGIRDVDTLIYKELVKFINKY